MSTIIGNIFTILGVIIGFVWIGIGMELGKEAYNVLIKDKATTILTRFKDRKARKMFNKLIDETKTIIHPKEEEKKEDANTIK